ncbi:MAG: hypothetical protein FJ117_08980 [Deltaproteobacteria bacterium]|nr:hypothetical protein [Deltaproteobacteria bacterium]
MKERRSLCFFGSLIKKRASDAAFSSRAVFVALAAAWQTDSSPCPPMASGGIAFPEAFFCGSALTSS